MADSASRAQRAAALEEKRRKLDELKKKRAMRAGATDRPASSGNLDDYIDGLLQQPAPAEAPRTTSATAAAAAAAAPTTTSADSASTPGDTAATDTAAPETTAPTPTPAPPPPPKVETFAVSTQTEPWEDETAVEEETPAVVIAPTDEEHEQKGAEETEAGEREPTLLSEDQVATEVTRPDFGTFLTTASKKVERILGTSEYQQTLLWDVGTTPSSEKKDESSTAASALLTGKQVYEAGKWTAHRDVTDVRWSPHSRDVFLASYHAPSTPYSMAPPAPHKVDSSMLTPRSGELQADGLVLLWSLSMPHRPEHVLTCASPVLTVRHASTPNMVLGGCASGQVVVWDIRAGGRYPVQTSAMSSSSKQSQQGHVHPICGMEITDGGAGLVTSSLDGRLNFWSMSNLREPVESIQVPGGSVSCLALAPESESLVLGDEQGSIFAVTASAAASANKKKTSLRRKQVRKLESAPSSDTGEEDGDTTTNGHFGMVTAVATRPRIQSSTGLAKGFCRGSAGLVLTAGVDWTTQLWAPAYKDTPLLSWTSHSYDSVSDVQWNPHNPGIFATASSNGTIGLWNLAQSLDESVTDGLVVSSSEQVEGLSKLSWSNPDGRRLAVAGGGGRVHVLTLADDVVRPKGDEDARIVQQLVARGFLSRP